MCKVGQLTILYHTITNKEEAIDLMAVTLSDVTDFQNLFSTPSATPELLKCSWQYAQSQGSPKSELITSWKYCSNMLKAQCKIGLQVQRRLAEEAYIFCCWALFIFFAGTYRWESANHAAAITAPTVKSPHPLLKYRQTSDPCCPPFLQGSKMCQILAQISTRIFEPGHFIGKQKQTCQGPMIGLPSQ